MHFTSRMNVLFCKNSHDIMDRVTNIAWKTIGGTSLGGFAYEYEAVGRIVSRSYAHGDPSQSSQKTYSYDDLARFASDGGVTYTYDAAANATLSAQFARRRCSCAEKGNPPSDRDLS